MASSRAGSNAAAGLWARHELRRRLVALLTLGVLAGLAASLALAAIAGARRSESAWERLSDATGSADAVVFASQVDVFGPDVDWAEVAALPYVEAAGSFGIPFVKVVDGPDDVDLDIAGMFSAPYGSWRTDVDRPIILEGRQPDPTDPTEVLAPPGATAYGISVGDEFVIRMPSEEQIATQDLFGEPEGAEMPVRVVGIGMSTFEMATIPGDGAGWITTPAFHDEFAGPVTFIDNLLVRFRPGQGSIAELERDARRIFDSPSMPVLDVEAASKRVTNGTGLEAIGLALFGAAVALTGAVLVGQALTRSVRSGSGDLASLSAMGFTRADGARALALPHVVPVVVACVVAFAGAVALSPRFPIGLARRVDPDVGLHLDLPVLVIGTAAMAAVLGLTVVVSAYRAAAPPRRTVVERQSRLARAVASMNVPPSLIVGTNLALEPGRDRRALPTRPALAGIAIGVLGVVASQTLLVAIDDAIAEPARFGTTWDLELSINDFSGALTFDEAMATVEDDDRVESSALVGRALVVIDGVTQPTYALVPRLGELNFTVLNGRAPESLGEVALGPETADSYGVGIGDEVTMSIAGSEPRTARVVGLALLPTTPHSNYDQGAWITSNELSQMAGSEIGELPEGADGTSTPTITPGHFAALRDGTSAEEVATELLGRLDSGLHDVKPPEPPLDASNLHNVRSLPRLFAAFTIVLAIGTIAHVSSSAVRRRGGELAVLRALGMTTGGIRAALGWQATILCLLGLVVGVPVGVVVGRVAWRVVADHTPLVFAPPVAAATILLCVPVALVVANLISLVPGRRLSRTDPASQLRSE